MTFRLSGPYSFFFDTNGAPLDGGLIDFYEAGTSTRKDTWTDSVKTTTNANPVVLDSEGKAQIALDGLYKIVAKDKNGVTLWTADNVSTPPTTADVTAAVQAALVVPNYPTVTAAATATITASVKQVLTAHLIATGDGGGARYSRVDSQPAHGMRFRSVDRYLSDGTESTANGGWWEIDEPIVDARSAGIKADNLTESATINATALGVIKDYVTAKAGGEVKFPAGTIRTNAAWALGTVSDFRMTGRGTILDFSEASGTDGVTISTGARITIEGLRVSGADSHGVRVTGAATDLVLDGVTATSCGGNGFQFEGGSRVRMVGCTGSSNTGRGANFAGTSKHEQILVAGSVFDNNTSDGIGAANVEGMRLDAVKSSGSDARGLHISNCVGLVITSPLVTGNTLGGIRLEATDALNSTHAVDNVQAEIDGAFASGNAVTDMLLQVFTSGSATVDVGLFNSRDVGATDSVTVTGSNENIYGANNVLSGTAPERVSLPTNEDYFLGKLLSSQTVSAAAQSDVSLTGAYDRYELKVKGMVPETGATYPYMRFRTTGGSVRAGASDYVWAVSANGIATASTGDSEIELTSNSAVATTASEGVSGTIHIYHPHDSSLKTRIVGHFILLDPTNMRIINMAGYVDTAEANDLVRLFMSAGNIASAQFELIGYRSKAA